MRLHPRPEQRDELGIEKVVVIVDIQDDAPGESRMFREGPRECGVLLLVHDEHDVRPLQHARVHLDERIRARARRPHVEFGILREHALGGGAALAIVVADEQHPNRTLRRSVHEFG